MTKRAGGIRCGRCGVTYHVTPRYPLQPLLELAGIGTASAAVRTLNVSGTRYVQFMCHGVTAPVADRLACVVGFHPALIWPEYTADQIRQAERDCAECGDRFVPNHPRRLYCRPRCKERANQRRNRVRHRETYRAQQRAWRERNAESYREYQREYQRRYMRMVRARKKAAV